MKSYLEFERNIKVLEEELEKLKDPFNKEGISEVDTQRISEIQMEINEKLKTSYKNLNEWERTQVARHEERPKANFLLKIFFQILLIYLAIENFLRMKQFLLDLLNLKVDQF